MTQSLIFFTSDTHFGDPNIIRTRKWLFASTNEMDAAMIAQWNPAVAPGDRVYHFGDYAPRSKYCFISAF